MKEGSRGRPPFICFFSGHEGRTDNTKNGTQKAVAMELPMETSPDEKMFAFFLLVGLGFVSSV
jgi:hypothetical protein